MRRFLPLLLGAIVVCAPALLLAQGPGSEEAPVDYRGKVTLAYGIVFGLVVIFIVLSMRRNAGLREEIDFLERRLDELEKSPGRAPPSGGS